MSNMYFYQGNWGKDLVRIAHLFSGQIANGDEPVNHYVVAKNALLGLISPDKYRKGVMPCYLEEFCAWGILIGELHESSVLKRVRAQHPEYTDLETLAYLYSQDVLEEVLPELNGAFFLILWYPQTETLVAANDRFGLYPMYWASNGQQFCLASRVLCSVLTDCVSGELDVDLLMQLITIDDYIGNATTVRGVSVFPPATLLVRQNGHSDWREYWHWHYRYEIDVSLPEWGMRIGQALIESVRRQTNRHDNLGITLSGGLDSRAIAACTHKLGLPVKSFTWGANDSWDRRIAQEVADALCLQHEDYDYEVAKLPLLFDAAVNETEGMCNLFDMHFLVHRHIIAQADVVLNGYAGGGILGGVFLRSRWFKKQSTDKLAQLVFMRFNTLLRVDQLAKAVPISREISQNRLPREMLRCRFSDFADMRPSDAAHRYIFENHIRRKTTMGTVLMRRVSESQACFFDYDFVDLVTSIPATLRANHAVFKSMYLHCFPEVAMIRWQATLLPAAISPRVDYFGKIARRALAQLEHTTGWEGPTKRQAVARFSEWLRSEYRTWIDDCINGPHPIPGEILDHKFCQKVWKEHLSGKDHTRLLGVIVPIMAFSHTLQAAQRKQLPRQIEPTKVSQSEGL